MKKKILQGRPIFSSASPPVKGPEILWAVLFLVFGGTLLAVPEKGFAERCLGRKAQPACDFVGVQVGRTQQFLGAYHAVFVDEAVRAHPREDAKRPVHLPDSHAQLRRQGLHAKMALVEQSSNGIHEKAARRPRRPVLFLPAFPTFIVPYPQVRQAGDINILRLDLLEVFHLVFALVFAPKDTESTAPTLIPYPFFRQSPEKQAARPPSCVTASHTPPTTYPFYQTWIYPTPTIYPFRTT